MCGFGWFLSASDWASDDDVTDSRAHGIGGGHDACLIAYVGAHGTNARGDDGESGAEFTAERYGFMGRADDAAASGHARQASESKGLVSDTAGESDFGEVFVGQAGEDRYGQDQRLQGGRVRGFGGSFQHFKSARGVDGQHADLQLSGLGDGVSDGVRDIVEFEVEKNFTAGSHQVANDLGPLGRKQLLTDFI